MNRLLSGTALVAALALAAPAWAEAPMTPRPLGGPYTSETAPAPPSTIYSGQSTPYVQGAPAEPRRQVMRRAYHKRHAAHMRMHHARRSSAPSDNIANQLNRQELGRVSGSSVPPATQGYSQQGQPLSSSGR